MNRKRKPVKAMILEQVVTKGGKRKVVRKIPIVPDVSHAQEQCQIASHAVPVEVNQLHEPAIFPDQQQPHTSQHYSRKEELIRQWDAVMEDMKVEYVTGQGRPNFPCCPQCGSSGVQDEEDEEDSTQFEEDEEDSTQFEEDEEDSTQFVFCEDCNRYMCTMCAIDLHEYHPLHVLKVWNKDGSCSAMSFKRLIKSPQHSCRFGYMTEEDIEVVDEGGKIFKCKVQVCTCTKLPVHLVGIGFWPSSPSKPTRAFHQGFLSTLVFMMLEGHVSLQSSCQAFMWKNHWTSKTMDSIYRQLSTDECFEEFRHFLHSMRTLDGLCPQDKCPACPKVGGTTFVSLDANFGLVRKQNAGMSVARPKHGDAFFIDDSEVASFVNEYGIETGKTGNSDCSNFQAGDAVRAKNKALQLDKTGVFGSICKHGFPFKFLNMEHGERYAYPVLVLKKIIEEMPNTSVTVAYDIACKLKAHLQRTKQTEILDNVELVLPCWHAYGHNVSCQVAFSTRWVTNCGLTDGEETERLWAYLRPFSSITKEMTPSHRIDLLSDALIHYGRRKEKDIVDMLKQRLDKADLIHKQARDELVELITDNHTIEDVCLWKEEEKARLKKWNKTGSKLSWEVEYVNKLQSYHTSRDQLAVTADEKMFGIVNQHCESINEELKAIEKKRGISRWNDVSKEYQEALKLLEYHQKSSLVRKLKHDVAEYLFMQETMKKHGGGQAISARIAKQLGKISKTIDNTVSRYNSNLFKTEYLLPRQVARRDALDVDHDMYYVQEERNLDVNRILQQKAVRVLNMGQRAEEEKAFIASEKTALLAHYQQVFEKIDNHLQEDMNRYQLGRMVMQLDKKEEIDDTIKLIHAAL